MQIRTFVSEQSLKNCLSLTPVTTFAVNYHSIVFSFCSDSWKCNAQTKSSDLTFIRSKYVWSSENTHFLTKFITLRKIENPPTKNWSWMQRFINTSTDFSYKMNKQAQSSPRYWERIFSKHSASEKSLRSAIHSTCANASHVLRSEGKKKIVRIVRLFHNCMTGAPIVMHEIATGTGNIRILPFLYFWPDFWPVHRVFRPQIIRLYSPSEWYWNIPSATRSSAWNFSTEGTELITSSTSFSFTRLQSKSEANFYFIKLKPEIECFIASRTTQCCKLLVSDFFPTVRIPPNQMHDCQRTKCSTPVCCKIVWECWDLRASTFCVGTRGYSEEF